MESDERVIMIGQGVRNPWYVGSTADGLDKRFGSKRIIDPPVSENGMNGVAIGAALSGLLPIVIHPRLDFLIMGLEQVFNQAANWSYTFGGKSNVPLVVRGIINRGGEQGAQHSQAIQAMFAHVPGLKVVMPASAHDAKGLLIAAVADPNPVIYIDDRWLYDVSDEVPEEMYSVEIGRGTVLRQGSDVTIVAMSAMVPLAVTAAQTLALEGIDVEIVDPRTIKPLDIELICSSVEKTGRLVIADAAWRTASFSAEIAALVSEYSFDSLQSKIVRVTLPNTPAPSSTSEEQHFYPTPDNIIQAVRSLF